MIEDLFEDISNELDLQYISSKYVKFNDIFNTMVKDDEYFFSFDISNNKIVIITKLFNCELRLNYNDDYNYYKIINKIGKKDTLLILKYVLSIFKDLLVFDYKKAINAINITYQDKEEQLNNRLSTLIRKLDNEP